MELNGEKERSELIVWGADVSYDQPFCDSNNETDMFIVIHTPFFVYAVYCEVEPSLSPTLSPTLSPSTSPTLSR